VSNPLPASADPHGISAAHTRRLSAPDRITRRAFPVTFERDACAPFRSGTGRCPGTSAASTRRLAALGLHRPSPLIRFGDEPSALRVSGSSSLRWADSPSCGLPCDSTRSTSPMHSTDFCFPLTFDYEHSRRVRSQHIFKACASPLRPGLAPRTEETGGPDGSRRPIRFGGRPRVFVCAAFLPRTPDATVPLTSLSPSRGPRPACAKRESAESAETVTASGP